jgi:hypothetical protein
MAAAAITETTRSVDGTTIAFERIGVGPALILVDAAGRHGSSGRCAVWPAISPATSP